MIFNRLPTFFERVNFGPAAVPIAMMAGGAIMSSIGAGQQAKATRKAAKQTVAAAEGSAQTQIALSEEQANLVLADATYQETLREAQAQSLEQQAGQARALAQRDAVETRRQIRFASSRARALAGASGAGAGALDPTVIGILGDFDNEAEILAQTSLYEGEEQALGAEYAALLERAAGKGDLFAARSQAKALRTKGVYQAYIDRVQGATSATRLLSGAAGTEAKAAGSILSSGASIFSAGQGSGAFG